MHSFTVSFGSAAFVIAMFVINPAFAFLGGGLDIKQFCEKTAERDTVLYVDDTLLNTTEAEWFSRLMPRLSSNLLPHERVTVVQLSPESGRTKEVWSGCWPDYTVAERIKIEEDNSIFTANPLRDLNEQRQMFQGQLQGAVSSIYSGISRAKAATNVSSPEKRDYIRALSSDAVRFARSKSAQRILIYGDLLESSDLGNVFDSQTGYAAGKELAERLKADFSHATIYAFGLAESVSKPGTLLDRTEEFWRAFFDNSNGHSTGISPDLTLPSSIPIMVKTYDLDMKVQDRLITGRLQLIVDDEGALQDSYVFFRGGRSAALSGSFVCSASNNCQLDATTSRWVFFSSGSESDRETEELFLTGTRDAMAGRIGVRGAVRTSDHTQEATLPVNATEVEPTT